MHRMVWFRYFSNGSITSGRSIMRQSPPSKGAVVIREASIWRAARYQKASACKHSAGSGNRSYTRDRSVPSLLKARDGLAQTNGGNDVSYAALRSKAQRSHGGKRFRKAQDSPTRRGERGECKRGGNFDRETCRNGRPVTPLNDHH